MVTFTIVGILFAISSKNRCYNKVKSINKWKYIQNIQHSSIDAEFESINRDVVIV